MPLVGSQFPAILELTDLDKQQCYLGGQTCFVCFPKHNGYVCEVCGITDSSVE